MKQFKNAVAVAIAAAGIYSVSAMAGTAVHWAGSDAGSAKDVKWQVVQPSRLDFTLNTVDITSVSANGGANSNNVDDPGSVGDWTNAGDAIYVYTADNHTDGNGSYSNAKGDVGNEELTIRFKDPDGTAHTKNGDMPIDGKTVWNAGLRGNIEGRVYVNTGSGWGLVSSMSEIQSTRFTD
ncbi:hypothetical protein GW721_24340, partial [Citrobacter braakii]|nr:hypothetical protein [Citrobacter braakii]